MVVVRYIVVLLFLVNNLINLYYTKNYKYLYLCTYGLIEIMKNEINTLTNNIFIDYRVVYSSPVYRLSADKSDLYDGNFVS